MRVGLTERLRMTQVESGCAERSALGTPKLGAGRYTFEARLQLGVSTQLVQGWGALPGGVDQVLSRAEILRTGRWLNFPKSWAREIMKNLRAAPHSEPLRIRGRVTSSLSGRGKEGGYWGAVER